MFVFRCFLHVLSSTWVVGVSKWFVNQRENRIGLASSHLSLAKRDPFPITLCVSSGCKIHGSHSPIAKSGNIWWGGCRSRQNVWNQRRCSCYLGRIPNHCITSFDWQRWGIDVLLHFIRGMDTIQGNVRPPTFFAHYLYSFATWLPILSAEWSVLVIKLTCMCWASLTCECYEMLITLFKIKNQIIVPVSFPGESLSQMQTYTFIIGLALDSFFL